MEKHRASLLIGIGVEIIVTIFGAVVKTMPMPLVIIFGVIGLALILYGLVFLIRSKGKEPVPPQIISESPGAQQASHTGNSVTQVQGDYIVNIHFHFSNEPPLEERRRKDE